MSVLTVRRSSQVSERCSERSVRCSATNCRRDSTDEIDDARAAYADGDVERGRELSQAVEATLATEVAARLDVTIGFSDADGDSAG